MKTLRNSEAKPIPNPGTTVGLDVGDRYSQFCILDEAGEIAAEGRAFVFDRLTGLQRGTLVAT
jgi:hypothetical protein